MHKSGTALVDDIHPQSPADRLSEAVARLSPEDLQHEIEIGLASAVLGMSIAFIARALNKPGRRPKTLKLGQIIDLLDVDGYQETFVRRSQVPGFLLHHAAATPGADRPIDGRLLGKPRLDVGNARDLVGQLAPGSVQVVVTSSPYWAMRIYENTRPVKWADGDHCAYGFEQTPEGFIRHTTELLYLLKPALSADGSVWWNLMDTYNTRTPIRGNARERLDAMGGRPDSSRGWTEHEACRHSAGHMFLADAEQCSIPARIAERASRIGYRLISYITWRKYPHSPEPVRNRVTRQAEYVLHLSPGTTAPLFQKDRWRKLPAALGGPNEPFESRERITDIWTLPVAQGKNGHGAEFPVELPARCIALSSREGDVICDPFMGSGTSGLAATLLGRRFIGFEISRNYVKLARTRLARTAGHGFKTPDLGDQLGFSEALIAPPPENGVGSAQRVMPPVAPVATERPRRRSRSLVAASPSTI